MRPVFSSAHHSGDKRELQLRTLAQHLWADIYHELGYKNEFQLPARWEREFARLAALLEYCDQGFEEIKNAMRTYESSYGHYMSKEQLESLAGRLEILLKVDGDNVKALHRLIKTYLALGHNDKIRMILERNEALLNSYPPALRDIGVAYCQAHKPRSRGFTLGKAFLRKVAKAEKKDIDALCSLGGAYRKEGAWGRRWHAIGKPMNWTHPIPIPWAITSPWNCCWAETFGRFPTFTP